MHAEKSLALAQAAVQQANAEVTQLTQQLQQLEQEVAQQSDPLDQVGSIEALVASMSRILGEMTASPLVAQTIVQETGRTLWVVSMPLQQLQWDLQRLCCPLGLGRAMLWTRECSAE